MRKSIALIIIVSSAIGNSCKHELPAKEFNYPVVSPIVPVPYNCNDSLTVTFSGSIRPLISAKCLHCHKPPSPSGFHDLSTYAEVKARVDDGKLFGAVNHLIGFAPMPKNSNKLSVCELGQINKWIIAGAPNN